MKKETKKTKIPLIFSFVFCYNFFVFQPISTFLVSKNHGRRPRFFEAKNTQKLRRVRKLLAKNKMKKQKKTIKILFFRLFFALTFLSFIRFWCFWSGKITGVASDFSRPRTRRNSKGFGSYEEKTKWKKQKKQKKRHFCFCFFALTFLSFIRFQCFWSRKITRVASNF